MGRAARLKKERKEAPAGITVGVLKAKITEIEREREQAIANLNALAGAKQAYEMLLADLAPKVKTEAGPKKADGAPPAAALAQ